MLLSLLQTLLKYLSYHFVYISVSFVSVSSSNALISSTFSQYLLSSSTYSFALIMIAMSIIPCIFSFAESLKKRIDCKFFLLVPCLLHGFQALLHIFRILSLLLRIILLFSFYTVLSFGAWLFLTLYKYYTSF